MLRIQRAHGWCSITGMGLLLATGVFVSPAAANPYSTCTEKLLGAKVDATVAASACAQDLHPEDLGECVDRVIKTNLSGTDALAACRKVRRPLDLATCVTEIHGQNNSAAMPSVLDYCRRSLLPARFGECVIGLSKDPLKLSTDQSMETCIRTSDRPTDLQLVPLNQVVAPSSTESSGSSSGMSSSSSSTMPATTIAPMTPAPTPSPTGVGLPQRY